MWKSVELYIVCRQNKWKKKLRATIPIDKLLYGKWILWKHFECVYGPELVAHVRHPFLSKKTLNLHFHALLNTVFHAVVDVYPYKFPISSVQSCNIKIKTKITNFSPGIMIHPIVSWGCSYCFGCKPWSVLLYTHNLISNFCNERLCSKLCNDVWHMLCKHFQQHLFWNPIARFLVINF